MTDYDEFVYVDSETPLSGSEENISEGTIREINEIINPSVPRNRRLYIPRFDQGETNLCLYFSAGIVIFRYIFNAIKLNYCHSIINLGETFVREKDYLRYSTNIYDIIECTHSFVKGNNLNLLFNPSYSNSKLITIEITDRDTTFKANPEEIRQIIILNFIILFLLGISYKFVIFDKANIYNNVDLYKGIDSDDFVNKIKLFFMYNSFIKQNNPLSKPQIYDFFQMLGYNKELVDLLYNFLIQLNLKELPFNSILPSYIKDHVVKERFLYYYKIINFKFIKKPDVKLRAIREIKMVFNHARKQGLYIMLSIDSYEKILDIPEGKGKSHSVVAIPVNNKEFIIVNTWGDYKQNIRRRFSDLITMEVRLGIYYLYFNYNNREKRTRKIPNFTKPLRKELNGPIEPFSLLRIKERITSKKANSLHLTKTKKKSSYIANKNALKPFNISSLKRMNKPIVRHSI